jgi:hypothetical protein
VTHYAPNLDSANIYIRGLDDLSTVNHLGRRLEIKENKILVDYPTYRRRSLKDTFFDKSNARPVRYNRTEYFEKYQNNHFGKKIKMDNHLKTLVDELAELSVRGESNNDNSLATRQLFRLKRNQLSRELPSNENINSIIELRVFELKEEANKVIECYQELLELEFVEIKTIKSLYNNRDYFASLNVHSVNAKSARALQEIIIVGGHAKEHPLYECYILGKIKRCLESIIDTHDQALKERSYDKLTEFQARTAEGILPQFQYDSILFFVENLKNYVNFDIAEIILFSQHSDRKQNNWTNVEWAVVSEQFANLSTSERAKLLRKCLPEDNPWITVLGITESEYLNAESSPLLQKIRRGKKLIKLCKSTEFY